MTGSDWDKEKGGENQRDEEGEEKGRQRGGKVWGWKTECVSKCENKKKTYQHLNLSSRFNCRGLKTESETISWSRSQHVSHVQCGRFYSSTSSSARLSLTTSSSVLVWILLSSFYSLTHTHHFIISLSWLVKRRRQMIKSKTKRVRLDPRYLVITPALHFLFLLSLIHLLSSPGYEWKLSLSCLLLLVGVLGFQERRCKISDHSFRCKLTAAPLTGSFLTGQEVSVHQAARAALGPKLFRNVELCPLMMNNSGSPLIHLKASVPQHESVFYYASSQTAPFGKPQSPYTCIQLFGNHAYLFWCNDHIIEPYSNLLYPARLWWRRREVTEKKQHVDDFNGFCFHS